MFKAINTNPNNPAMVNGAGIKNIKFFYFKGSGNALKVLVNIERYERILSCTPKYRTTSLPSLKILIYNQTESIISSLEGVNVLPGRTLDIPFRQQQVI